MKKSFKIFEILVYFEMFHSTSSVPKIPQYNASLEAILERKFWTY